jgi:hypothetical protein
MTTGMPGAPPELVGRDAFRDGIRSALAAGRGFAAAKIGASEVCRLNYSVVAARVGRDSKLLRALNGQLVFHGLRQSALFPPDPAFYLGYNELYVESMRALDCLGIFPELWRHTLPLLQHWQLRLPLTDYLDQEPDRSSPADEARCYLPLFRGKRLLLVSSFAGLLRQRADRNTFEAVWVKTGKPWFGPATVDALEFPYGYSADTHRRYGSSLDLIRAITGEMDRRDYDVALVGAGGMGIPLVAHAKRRGKVAIHLGGHLQVVFGVIGRRWRERVDWQARYFNEHWIDMPARYRPPEAARIADYGAYW